VLIAAGVLSPLENLFRTILFWLHDSGHLSWAWSIVALTVIVRILIVPLTVKQIHSMQSLQVHAPEMKEIQKRYKHDKPRQQQELMRFYKENSINPMASCLPMLAQFPVFIALYYVLRNFSKHAPCPGHPGGSNFCVARGDFSWLGHDFFPNIASKIGSHMHWSGWLLVAIYAGSQLASTYFMSTAAQKSQRIMMMVLPFVVLPFIFQAKFPIGLVLYWATTNLWTVGQGLITRTLIPKPPPPVKRSSRTPSAAEKKTEAQTRAPQPPRRVKRKKKGGRR
jgi:YidC/Oxa1 family membrane protein insertase